MLYVGGPRRLSDFSPSHRFLFFCRLMWILIALPIISNLCSTTYIYVHCLFPLYMYVKMVCSCWIDSKTNHNMDGFSRQRGVRGVGKFHLIIVTEIRKPQTLLQAQITTKHSRNVIMSPQKRMHVYEVKNPFRQIEKSNFLVICSQLQQILSHLNSLSRSCNTPSIYTHIKCLSNDERHPFNWISLSTKWLY